MLNGGEAANEARATALKRRSKEAMAVFVISLSMLLLTGAAPRSQDPVQKVIFVRHGEANYGIGQLNCQGLNRALALPSVIAKTFGRPDAIFAPDPDERLGGYEKEPFDYVRPLATILPTAISFGLPVNVSIGATDGDGLRATLKQPQYKNALVLIAWEHREIEATVRALLAAHGADAAVVPKWKSGDFDSIYVVTITSIGDATKATFALMGQRLDGQKETCPS
jgi:hypothetical protein